MKCMKQWHSIPVQDKCHIVFDCELTNHISNSMEMSDTSWEQLFYTERSMLCEMFYLLLVEFLSENKYNATLRQYTYNRHAYQCSTFLLAYSRTGTALKQNLHEGHTPLNQRKKSILWPRCLSMKTGYMSTMQSPFCDVQLKVDKL